MEPLTTGIVAAKGIATARATGSVMEGNDPSLINLAAVFAPVPESEIVPGSNELMAQKPTEGLDSVGSLQPTASEVGEDTLLDKRIIGTQVTQDGLQCEQIVLEKRVDSRYLSHGNLEDAWLSAKNGELSVDTLLLALVDVIDILTLGLFRPMLLEIKVNHHLKARQVHYRATVSYGTPQISEPTSQQTDQGSLTEQERVQKRLTKLEKLSVEISPEFFDRANTSFAEAAEQMQHAGLADRTIVCTRLDTLTEKDIQLLTPDGQKQTRTLSQRVQTIQTPDDSLVELIHLSPADMRAQGAQMLQDRENLSRTVVMLERGPEKESMKLLSRQTENSWLVLETDTQHYLRETEQQLQTTTQQQVELVDHLAGSKELLQEQQMQEESIIHTQEDVVTENRHSRYGRSFWGEATTTTTTPRAVVENTVLTLNGEPVETNTTHLTPSETRVEKRFDEGHIDKVPFVGGIGNLASKATLAGPDQLTAVDVAWAGADVAEIGAVVATGGWAATATVPAKTGAKMTIKSALKSAGKSEGRALVKGSIRLGNRPALNAVTPKVEMKGGLTQSGKLDLGDVSRVGAKARSPETGAIVHYRNIPRENGSWTGAPGDSIWHADPHYVPANLKANPQGLNMGSIYKQNSVANGISYRGGYADFSPFSHASVKISHFSDARVKNFAQADTAMATGLRKGQHFGNEVQAHLRSKNIAPSDVTPGDIARMREERGLTWHEKEDMSTLELISKELHGSTPHRGGVSLYKELNPTN